MITIQTYQRSGAWFAPGNARARSGAMFVLLVCSMLSLAACSGPTSPEQRDDPPASDAERTAIAATVEALPDSGIVGPPPPPGHAEGDPFEGRVWGLTEIADADGPRAVLAGSEVNLLFLDGKVSGSAGCNTVAGAYERSGTSLSIGALGATRMLCARPEGVMEQERAVLAALERVTTIVLEDGLELRDDAGEVRLRFISAADRPLDLTP